MANQAEKKAPPQRITLVCYPSEELKERIRAYAEREDRSMAVVTRRLLEEAMNRVDQQHKLAS